MRHSQTRRRGQSLTEYLAIVGLLVLACAVALEGLGKKYAAGFEETGKKISTWVK